MATGKTVFPKGSERHDTIATRGGAKVRLKYATGAVVGGMTLLEAARTVPRGKAQVVGDDNRPLRPTLVVICRKEMSPAKANGFPRIGQPIEVINPGILHTLFLLFWSVSVPLVPKNLCKPASPCHNTDDHCGNCHNRSKT
jgi:hypothetical protein